jgi:CDP-glycerol glycerophosphotransferase (TagB/SpsB family)
MYMTPRKLEKMRLRLLRIAKQNSYDLSLSVLSWLVPKDRDLYLFNSDSGRSRSGNPKYLNRYLQGKKKTLWIGNEDTYSWRAFWATLRAKHIIIDNGLTGTFARGLLSFMGRFSIIQTWHGTGVKGLPSVKGGDWLLRETAHRANSVVLASSPAHQEVMEKIFKTKAVITGSPRTDTLFRPGGPQLGGERNILYAPTFRDNGQFQPFTRSLLECLDEWLAQNDYTFLLKLHPHDRGISIVDDLSHIIEITDEDIETVELLKSIDILITDYSSIATDIMLTGKPIIFYLPDHEEFTKHRPLAFSLNTLPGPFVCDEELLLSFLEDMGWSETAEYRMKYDKSRDFWHTYQDGRSCERVEALLEGGEE